MKKGGALLNYVYSLIGAFLMAFAVGNVLEPMHLVTGGISGLGIIIKQYSAVWFQKQGWFAGQALEQGIPLWITSIVFNIPLFIAAYKKKGIHFLGSSLWGAAWLTIFLAVLPEWDILPRDYVLNSLFGGLIEGLGIGLVLLAKSSTGGADLFATLLHERLPQYSIPKIMACHDGVIVALGFMAFGIENGLYALITIFIISRISDTVIGGFGHAMVAYIISDESQRIAGEVMRELNRGITGIGVKGMYRNKERTMLMCVASKKQLVYVKEIVSKYDPLAFVIITDARETLGEGFASLGNNTR